MAWAEARRAWRHIAIFLVGWCVFTTVMAAMQRTPFLKGLTVGFMLGLLGMYGVLFLVVTGIAQRQMGGTAEQWTAEALAKLPASRWCVVHDLAFDSSNVDHVIVGPGRVYAVETKWTTWSEHPKFVDSAVAGAQRAARKMRSFLRSQNLAADVIPLLVIWGPGCRHRSPEPQWVDGVGILVGKHAGEWLPRLDASARDVERDQEAIDALTAFAEQHGRESWSPAATAAFARA